MTERCPGQRQPEVRAQDSLACQLTDCGSYAVTAGVHVESAPRTRADKILENPYRPRSEALTQAQPETFGESDLYPDARPAMAALRDMGVWVGIAGNQTSRAGGILRKLDLPADMIATSDDWGAAKPDASFFRAVTDSVPCDPAEIVYVGDRVDNDLTPAKEAGMRTAFIRRGPWGYIWERHPDMPAVADWQMTTLAELPGIVADVNRPAR